MPLSFASCPFCNASMPLPEPAPRRMTCVRCGEQFPVQAPAEAVEINPSPAPLAAAPPAEIKRRNRRVGLIVVAIMAAVFVAALIFVIESRSRRGMRSLAESPALGYLPDDTNVIVAVNVEAADEVRKERKAEKEPDIVDRLFFGENAAVHVERMTGFQRGDVEEIMLGLKVDENLIPKFRLIVRTRSSYDAEALRDKLGAFRSKQEGAKTLDSIRPQGVPLEAVLWCATAKTFVITLTPEDMAKVPDEPAKNVDRLAPQLVDLMRYHSDKGTFFWLIGHAENWEPTTLGLLLKTSKKLTNEERKKLFKLQTFAVAMRVDSGTVTSRARPARITENVDPQSRGYAVDLALTAANDEDAVEVRDLFELWLKNQQLEIRGEQRKGPVYSATLSGTPDDWNKAVASIRGSLRFR